MGDEKDRFGDTLHKKEKAEEDRFFAHRDQELIERLRGKTPGRKETDAPAPMRCPRCGAQLVSVDHQGVTADECPDCHGTWLDAGELEALAARERDSWLTRYFHRPRR